MEVIELSGSDWRVSYQRGPLPDNLTAAALGALPATVPGSIQMDLLAAKLTGDPYMYGEEMKQRWIAKCDWRWSKTFTVPKEARQRFSKAQLVLDGVDTISKVFVNGEFVGETDSQFKPFTFPVDLALLKDGDNEIVVEVKSPVEYSDAKWAQVDYDIPAMHYVNGEKHWNFIRKRACSFGWDWGPAFPTMGLDKPLRLVFFDFRISRLVLRQKFEPSQLKEKTPKAEVFVELHTHGVIPHDFALEASLGLVGKEKSKIALKKVDGHSHSFSFTIDNPSLWYPNKQGPQALYEIEFHPMNVGALPTVVKRFGVRTVELIREKDGKEANSKAESFYFKINGRSVYSLGANWIPPDCFASRVDKERLRSLLKSAQVANMNTIRIWGGGEYESDEFYGLCDELGLLIWHDLMFACSLYPADASFLDNVRQEVEYQVSRLQEHPSMLLICGNNENEEALFNDWLKSDAAKSRGKEPLIVDYRKLFIETIYPAVQKAVGGHHKLAPSDSLPFWPSSPSNGIDEWGNPAVHDRGDIHYWGVWHGGQGFQKYFEIKPRFSSEFGFQSFPSKFTLASVFSKPEDWNLSSPEMEFRQRSPAKGNLQIIEHVFRHFRFPKTFDLFLIVSQILQGLSIKTAIEHWRRLKPYCMGAIYWQLNDIWPGASWSSLEYDGRWKMLQYFAKRAFEPLLLSFHEDPLKEGVKIEDAPVTSELWLTSELSTEVAGKAQVDLWSIAEQRVIQSFALDFSLLSGESKKLWSLPNDAITASKRSQLFLTAKIISIENGLGQRLDEAIHFLAKFKEITFPKAKVTAKVLSSEKKEEGTETAIEVSTDNLTPFVCLQSNFEGFFSDNSFQMMPQSQRSIKFISAKAIDVKAFAESLEVIDLASTYL